MTTRYERNILEILFKWILRMTKFNYYFAIDAYQNTSAIYNRACGIGASTLGRKGTGWLISLSQGRITMSFPSAAFRNQFAMNWNVAAQRAARSTTRYDCR